MILITEFMDENAVSRLTSAHATKYIPDLADRQHEIPGQLDGVQALIVRNRTRVNEALLSAAPNLSVIGRLGVGLDNIDQDACKARRVEVIPAIGANTLSVAEYVITNALILLRNAYQANAAMIAGDWPRTACSGREVAGRKLGLVGFGGIARETARLAGGLGMTVCACDPFLPGDDSAWNGVERSDLNAVLETADAISLHVPLTEATYHLIDADSFARMRQDAVLINAARGGVVDEAALAAALRSGRISGAALDVFETEPLTAAAAQIFSGVSNLILTPHIAGVTQNSNSRVSEMIATLVLDRLSQRAR